MAFGRNRRVEPFEPVHWDAITQFTVGRMMRHTMRKSTRGEGPHAVRFRARRGGDTYMVPGVYIVPVDPAVALAKGGFRLFEDEAARRLLCTVLPDGSDRYRVTDAAGQELGSVRRTPVTKRFSQHGLWLEQPGHPDIVAPRKWAKGGPMASLGRGAGHVAEHVVDGVLSAVFLGANETSGSGGSLKPLVWVLGVTDEEYGQVVLTFPHSTQSERWYFINQDSPLDKRLAFALAVVRESEIFRADQR
ncbi:hypothetical protein [Streptomyces sp. AC154]|uniref:hypothetical protein n=1 Tax=Streptomyces sp. AC154 TaxID=3143184 RepID=UPI003F803A73